MSPAASAMPERCPRCGSAFACGMNTGNCWCAQLPPLAQAAGAAAELVRLPASCLCPACLRALLSGAGGSADSAAGCSDAGASDAGASDAGTPGADTPYAGA
ncbi:MAG: cysteine-rich CWC family protein [Burkholderiales bacterium]|mgnify:CR=1 FL=1|nr:cysteine-rich CWC family protein [Burkholderiales bacterium]